MPKIWYILLGMADSPKETAIRAFETATGLDVVVHDLSGRWWSDLPPGRGHHHRSVCRAVKQSVHADRCIALEIDDWRTSWTRWPDGRVHCCHAGLVEWVVPMARTDELLGVLFAGQRLPDTGLELDHLQRSSGADRIWRTARQVPATVAWEEATRVLELLRQLAARLMVLADSARSPVRVGDRWWRCDRFLQDRHADSDLRVADLASHLGLSESRLAHLLHDRGAGTFVELLTASRLRSAMAYLRNTTMSIAEVALASGFGDVSHFHRVFRKTCGLTPLRFRREAAS